MDRVVTARVSRAQVAPFVLPQVPRVSTQPIPARLNEETLEKSESSEKLKFTEYEFAVLCLLIASLNQTEYSIDDHNIFEFKVDDEVIDICNRWVWSLPFEHAETIKLDAKTYLRLRKIALEKARDILQLDVEKVAEVAQSQGNQDAESLLIALALGEVGYKDKIGWLFEEILSRPGTTAWQDEAGYITQLWRESTEGTISQGLSAVDVIENTLQNDEYLEIIPVDYSKPSVEELEDSTSLRMSALEERDPDIRGKINEYIQQVKAQKRMPSLVNSGMLSQYFKPAINATLMEAALADGFVSPALFRNNIPYYDIDDMVVLLYMRNKLRSIDITGLQKELRGIVTEELKNFDNSN